MRRKGVRKALSAMRWVAFTMITLVLIGLMTSVICGIAFATYVNKYINPNLDINLDNFRLNFTSFIYYTDKNGQHQKLEDLYGAENRVWADYKEIPQNLVNAFISIEDARFETHNGVDWKRTIGAALGWTGLVDNFVGGGSTITQQLIKNVTGEDDVTVSRKVQEVMRALELEKEYSKEEIMEIYLNTIYLSQNCNGVKTAAQVYFNKELSKLSLAECASLAGITKNPSYYDPFRFPEHNKDRQELILGEMLKYGKITEAEYEKAKKEELKFNTSYKEEAKSSTQSYFVDQVISDVLSDLQTEKGYSKELSVKLLYSGGLNIYTTVDMDIQNKMDEVFISDENFPDIMGKDGSLPEAAMVIIDPYTGEVKAMVGGRGEKEGKRVWNRATQSTRSPGSSIKPLSVYAPALEYGVITPTTVMDDTPKDFTVNPKGWPSNYYKNSANPNGSAYRGRMTISKAVEISNNTIPVEILQKMTPEKSFSFLNINLGIKTMVRELVTTNSKGKKTVKTDIAYAPLALGGLTKGITPMQLCASYASFVNSGLYTQPRTYTKVTDSSGNVILEKKPVSNVAMKEKTAFYMRTLLQQVVNGSQGTGAKAKIANIATAGKTGTTDDDVDRWFVGFTPYYVGTVWFGYDVQQEVKVPSAYGNPALVLWKKVMDKVHEGLEPANFPVPEGYVKVSYCMDSGGIPSQWCQTDPRGNRIATAIVAREDMPKETCAIHVPVGYDTTTNRVATDFCPLESVKTVSLLNILRIFPIPGIHVDDQQYTVPGLTAAGEGAYPAVPNAVKDGVAYNTICTEHTFTYPGIEWPAETDDGGTGIPDESDIITIPEETSPEESETEYPPVETIPVSGGN